jgi:hypothetical protein
VQTVSFQIAVTVVSGTTPTLDCVIQETMDGTNYYDVYHFERITATGNFWSPPVKINGIGIRYVRTVAGTTPSFTMSAIRISRSISTPLLRKIHDRTIAPNTLNSTTAAMLSEGCEEFSLVASMAAGGTGPSIDLQGSDDNSNWYKIGSSLTATAGATTYIDTGSAVVMPKWIRGLISSAGTGATLNYITLKGKSRG